MEVINGAELALLLKKKGIKQKTVCEKLDIDQGLVGQQDYRIVGDDGMSKKQKMAIDLVNNGSSIEIISEDDFLKYI